MDSLHVIAGVLLQLVVAAILRTDVADRRPWLLAFGLELANEANDLVVERWPDPGMQWGEGAKDVLLTMLLPTLLLLLSRRCSGILALARR
ncbi:hypothetical protein OMW55_04530 [Sphingomonas sp. BN140010]|uniref:Uncharacterized protein n=1 Tax=Sphingomonas arvum TaxID=2992113 RepID=A0ABT3JDF3_9SPHN|nr:hypothetical protein [Sphingomonas sp. BN140010]MCW3797071.1 hypothetical protein [Sphingomonas sp. BN140010]